jgi:hypothetical protein
MPETATCEVFLVIDQNGDYAVGNTPETAREKFEEDIGPLADCESFRCVKLIVAVPLPEMPVLTGSVPALPVGEGLTLCVA